MAGCPDGVIGRGGGLTRGGRAVVLRGAGLAEITEVVVEEPTPTQVRVHLDGCGVCGSNLPVWEGRPWFAYPLAPGDPGHEGWGEVVALGAAVTTLQVGDRVAVLADGAYATDVVVEERSAVALPPALDRSDFPGEALGAAFNVAARSGFGPGRTVAVVGVGFIGAVVTAIAARAGCDVVAVSRRPFSLDVAKAMGAKEVVTMADPDQATRDLARLSGGDGFDVVVEAVGTQVPLDVAGAAVGVRGRLVIAGFHQDGPRTVDLQGWNWRGIDVVNAHEREPEVIADGVRRAAVAVADGQLDLAALLTHRFPLDRTGDALEAMAQRPDGFLKAVVVT